MRWLLLGFFICLASCSDRIVSPVVPIALETGENVPVFVATNRVEDPAGTFGIGRSQSLQLMQYTVSIPEVRQTGSISDGKANPKPDLHFALAERTDFNSLGQFGTRVRSAITDRSDPEVIVYVHGFNNSFSDAAFRMAQLTHDLRLDAPAVSFSWPSRGNPFGYQYDQDSAIYSRDALARLLKEIRSRGPARILLVAHSMGSALTMEALRTLELQEPGWSERSLSAVIFVSPDLNVDVFRAQASAFETWPQPFVIFSSRKDIMLQISARLRGEDRQLGKLNSVDEISDLPISFVDVTEFSEGTNHFIAGSSEGFIRLINSAENLEDAFWRGRISQPDDLLGEARAIGNSIRITLGPGAP